MSNLKRTDVQSDMNKVARPLISSYKEWLANFQNKKAEITTKLMKANRDYLEQIDLCMVDLEDFLEKKVIYLDSPSYDPLELQSMCAYHYELKVKDIQKFLDLEEKIKNIIGPYSYQLEWILNRINVPLSELMKCNQEMRINCYFDFDNLSMHY